MFLIKLLNSNTFLYSNRNILALVIACCFATSVEANPEGGSIAAGDVGFSQDGSKLEITQKSEKAIIDWKNFDIAPDETTQFNQPSSSSIVLNRVHSGSASKIEGALTANGNIIIVNQNGVWFGSKAVVDVNGLIATTSDISNDAFMKGEGGRLVFDKPGLPDASIINEGQITAKEAGLIGLVAPNVINRGVIQAQFGQVHLVSGSEATIDLYGDGLLSFAVSGDIKSQLLENTGTIQANGGTIALTAAAGQSVVNSLVTIKGELRAPAIGERAGKIIISAQGSNTSAEKDKKEGSSVVNISGTIDASGRDDKKIGGTISITGDEINFLDGASIFASGNETNEKSTENSITIIAGKSFTNQAKSDVLSYEAGRWIIYSNTPESNKLGELKSDFRRFSCTYGGSCPSYPSKGNGLLYRITPLLTVTPNAIANITYGANKPSLTNYAYNISGYMDDDAGSDSLSGVINGSTNYSQGSGVGTYGIDFANGGLSSSIGYGLSYASNISAFSVTPRALFLTANAKTKIYGDADPSLNYQITSGSLFASDAITGSLKRTIGENVGTYAIGQNTLSAGSNYTISYSGNNLAINKASLAVNALAQTKLYGDTDPLLSYGYTGLKNGDTASVFTGTQSRAMGENVGNYAIGQNTLSAGGNYTISYSGNNLTISKASLAVNALAQTKLYGDTDPLLSYNYTGLRNGDTASVFTGTQSRTVGENIGSYAIGQNTLSAGGNYTISYTGNNLTISKAALAVTAADKNNTISNPLVIPTVNNAMFDVIKTNNPIIKVSVPARKSISIPVTVTRVSHDTDLNLDDGITHKYANREVLFQRPTVNDINGSFENSGTSNYSPISQSNDDNQSQSFSSQASEVFKDSGWLTVSPELAARLGKVYWD